MERRKFLFFLPMLALTPKVVARSFIDLGSGTSLLEDDWIADVEFWDKEMQRMGEYVIDHLSRDNVFYATLQRNDVQLSARDMRVPLIIKPGGSYE